MKILLIGRDGQVAWELRRELACLGDLICVDRHSTPYALDMADADSITETVAVIQPNLIVNAAANTAVDKAEQADMLDLVMKVNGTSLGILGEAAKKCRATVIHYSTDYVFDGSAKLPYVETDATAPQGIYGQSKLLGEQALMASGAEHLILRTAWVYGGRGQNFLLTMLRLMQERDSLGIVADQFGSPTWCRQIALATAVIVAQSRRDGQMHLGEKQGIYHLTSLGQASWFEFAQAIYQQAHQLGILQRDVTVKPLTTADYPTPAKRPAYSVLSGQKLLSQFDVRLPDWQSGLQDCLADYAGARLSK